MRKTLQPITKYANFVSSGPSVARTAASPAAAAAATTTTTTTTTAAAAAAAAAAIHRHQDPAAAADPLRVQAGTGKVRYKLKRNFLL